MTLFFALSASAEARPPWGTLFCFNPLFVFINVSLHTPPIIQWNPCEAYQLNTIIKHKHSIVKTFCYKYEKSPIAIRDWWG